MNEAYSVALNQSSYAAYMLSAKQNTSINIENSLIHERISAITHNTKLSPPSLEANRFISLCHKHK